MKKILCAFVLLISCTLSARPLEENFKSTENNQVDRIGNSDINFQLPRFIFNYTNTRVVVKFVNPANSKLKDNNNQLNFIVNGVDQAVIFDENGIGSFYYTFKNENKLQILMEDLNYTVQPDVISIWYIVSPLLIVILFFMYRIVITVKKNKPSKLIVQHNIINDNDTTIKTFTSTLKVVRVKEMEEQF